MVAGATQTSTVNVADADPTVTCNVMVVPPGLVTYPVAVALPVGLVVVETPLSCIAPDCTCQVTGAPGIGLLNLSVTCTRNGTGKVVSGSTTWLLPLIMLMSAAAPAVMVRV